MDSFTEFEKLARSLLEDSDYSQNELFKNRFERELKEIHTQMESDYFLKLINNQSKFAENENNLFIAQLLGFTEQFDINADPVMVLGEFPDIDLDFLPLVQKYLKTEWAPKTFGVDRVCSIGNYAIFKIKSSLVDMARVFGKSRSEILSITTKIGLKDDEGKAMNWDAAMRLYPELQKYCDANPDVAAATKRLLHRNRSRGKHAAGLIISSVPLDEFVPICVDQDGNPVSAFVEGLSGTDLGPLGLIKFDLLVITNILAISKCCHIIKQRYPHITSISALPDAPDWSDISYLNDPKALKLADEGKLKCVFQFDGQGIQSLVKRGGVTSFDDLVAYSAIYRPGCLLAQMDKHYIERKRGREKYEMHSLVSPILSKTYGIMVFQEQIMRMLNKIGEIPDMHCEIVRKAISKKKFETFTKYKEMFLTNGKNKLNCSQKEIEELWSNIEKFSEYGFNKSMTANTLIPTPTCVKKIKDFVPGDEVFCVDQNGKTVTTKVVALHDHGGLEGFEVTFDDGYQIACSANHKFLTENGQVSLREICETHSSILCDHSIGSECAKKETRWMGNVLRDDFSKQKRILQTFENMPSVQTKTTKNAIGEIQICGSLWRKDDNKRSNVGSSTSMRIMSSNGMEKFTRQIHDTMRNGILCSKRARRTSKNLQQMHRIEKNKYQKSNGQIEQRQSDSRKKENIFRYSQTNIEKSRVISCSGCMSQKMERRKSRKICQMCSSNGKVSKNIKTGDLAKKSIKMGLRKNSLWRRSQTSRFCKRKYLDRSGWLLSFFRTQEQFKKSISSSKSPSQRQNAERRMFEEKKCDVAKIEHGMFPFFNRSDEIGDMGLGAGHAQITDTRNLVHRKIVRVRSVGKCHMFDLEVANPTHNYLLTNGIVTSNSHAVAYTYISSRLIYLKAHYPLEFFASVLSCEDKDEKVKEYKNEAVQMGIPVERVTLNKSREVFEIVDDKIYMGFANIKGIGEDPAKRIVQSAPYTGLEDFLNRFGTDKNTLKRLIALQMFGSDVGRCWAYYEKYKKAKDSVVSRRKRYWDGVAKNTEAVKSCVDRFNFNNEQITLILENLGKSKKIPERLEEELAFIDIPEIVSTDLLDIMHTVSKKYIKSKEGFLTKEADDSTLSFDDFVYSNEPDEEIKPYVDVPIQMAENEFYGFSWEHIIETSPEYEPGNTYADFEADEHAGVKNVQVWIVQKPKKITAKTGTVYYNVTTEDANSKIQDVTFWSDDYDRFKEELEYWENDDEKGHFLSMRVKKPSGGFNKYSFDAPPKQYRWRDVPKDKKMDARILVLARPEKIVPKPKVVKPKPIKENNNDLIIELNKILEF